MTNAFKPLNFGQYMAVLHSKAHCLVFLMDFAPSIILVFCAADLAFLSMALAGYAGLRAGPGTAPQQSGRARAGALCSSAWRRQQRPPGRPLLCNSGSTRYTVYFASFVVQTCIHGLNQGCVHRFVHR